MRSLRYAWLLLLCIVASCGRQAVEDNLLPIVQKALSDTASVYYADFSGIPEQAPALSIGIFDDDLSGLGVLEAFLQADHFNNITGNPGADGIRDFAGENFVYLADVANASYNEYAGHGNLDFLKESVVRDALFLLDDAYYNQTLDEQPYGVKSRAKFLVCADASASTFGLADVETLLDRSMTGVSACSVVDAAVLRYLSMVRDLPEASVGILADPGLVDAGHYEQAFRKLSSLQQYGGRIRVYHQKTVGLSAFLQPDSSATLFQDKEQAMPGGVVLPELGYGEGKIDLSLLDRYNFDFADGAMTYRLQNDYYSHLRVNSAENLIRYHLVSLVEKYRKQANGKPLQAIVVACPHSAAMMNVLQETMAELRAYKRNGVFLYQDVIAENFCFIDPAAEVARYAYETLRDQRRLALRANPTEVETYLTMPTYGTSVDALLPNGMFVESFRYARKAGTEILTTKPVPMAYRYLSLSDLEHMQQLAPTAYKLIVNRLY